MESAWQGVRDSRREAYYLEELAAEVEANYQQLSMFRGNLQSFQSGVRRALEEIMSDDVPDAPATLEALRAGPRSSGVPRRLSRNVFTDLQFKALVVFSY